MYKLPPLPKRQRVITGDQYKVQTTIDKFFIGIKKYIKNKYEILQGPSLFEI